MLIPIKTKGDRIKTAAQLRTAGKGLFVKEIEQALLSRKIDLAVHSLKDMPSEQPEKLVIGAVLARDEAADAFVGNTDIPIEKLPAKTVIGTSSLRRQAQLNHYFPHLRVVEMKGNLDTRLGMLTNKRTNLQGIVVAAAGLHRLYPSTKEGNGLPVSVQLLPKESIVPCPGQGALCIETREDNEAVLKLIQCVHDEETAYAVRAERHLMARLEGGCQVPLGVYALPVLDGFHRLLHLTATVGLPDGSKLVLEEAKGSLDDPISVAQSLETMLRARGATDILAELSNGRPGGHPVRRRSRPAKKARRR